MHRQIRCFVPRAELSTSAAGEEEDGPQDQDSDQEDGQDHQEEHVAISVLLALERDPLKGKKQNKNGNEGGASDSIWQTANCTSMLVGVMSRQ